MARISPETIEKVAAASDIVTVIGSYFPLKRAGSSFRALCPFHSEKSPSFHVNPQRQSYHCFGCGAGGTVFGFVMAYENVDFPTAVRNLAEKAGVPILEEAGSPDEDRKRDLRRRLIDLHLEAARYFNRMLLKSQAGEPARSYLRSRGFGPETVKEWRLGYAPDGWENLLGHLRGEGFKDHEIIESGLVSHREESQEGQGIYDRFRARLMIPICNDTGDVIAFSGRLLDADAKAAKYVNSPETPLFIKGNVLFGLHRTKRALINARSAIVCEGQIDLIRCFEAGVENVTAPQGTAFTPRQAAILKRYVEEVILCFDADTAGRKAAERSAPSLFEAGLTVKVASMPKGEDPDSLIRTQGADRFREVLGAAPDYFDFLIDSYSTELDLSSPRDRARFAGVLAEAVAPIGDPVVKQAVTGNVASRIGVDPAMIRDLILRAPKTSAPVAREEAPQAVEVESAPVKLDRSSAQFCRILLTHPSVKTEYVAAPDRAFLGQVPGGDFVEVLLDGDFRAGDPPSIAAFVDRLSPRFARVAAKLLTAIDIPDLADHARECWNAMHAQVLKQRMEVLKNQVRQFGGDDPKALEVHKEILDLKKLLTEIARPLR